MNRKEKANSTILTLLAVPGIKYAIRASLPHFPFSPSVVLLTLPSHLSHAQIPSDCSRPSVHLCLCFSPFLACPTIRSLGRCSASSITRSLPTPEASAELNCSKHTQGN